MSKTKLKMSGCVFIDDKKVACFVVTGDTEKEEFDKNILGLVDKVKKEFQEDLKNKDGWLKRKIND